MTALAVADALVEHLRDSIGAAVWTAVPDKTSPPYTVIGQITSDPVGGKTCRAEWHIVEILEWSVGTSAAPVRARLAATKLALDKVKITFTGLAPFTAEWLPGATDELHDDGRTWSGSQRFRILGQPAD